MNHVVVLAYIPLSQAGTVMGMLEATVANMEVEGPFESLEAAQKGIVARFKVIDPKFDLPPVGPEWNTLALNINGYLIAVRICEVILSDLSKMTFPTRHNPRQRRH